MFGQPAAIYGRLHDPRGADDVGRPALRRRRLRRAAGHGGAAARQGEGGVALDGVPARAPHVVLVLLDAFGWRFFTRHGDHPLLRRFDAVVPLTTQFPSTTTAHVTTLHTGVAVGEHGLYEWNVYEPSVDALITPMLFCYAGDAARDTLRRAGVEPSLLWPSAPTFYERLARTGVASHVFGPASFTPSTVDGVLARGADIHPVADLPSGLAALGATLHAADRPAYAYFYWNEVDAIGHQYGPSSPQFAAAAQRCLDALDAGLRALPEGTIVLLAADHGQVDVDPATTVYVNEAWPEIVDLLARDGRGARWPPRARRATSSCTAGPRRSTRWSTVWSACCASARRSTAWPTSSPPAGWARSASPCVRGWPTSACCRRRARRSGGASAIASTCASAVTTAGSRRTRRAPRSPRWSSRPPRGRARGSRPRDQDRPQLAVVAGGAPALLPLGLDGGDVVQPADDEVPAARGQADEPRTAVGGVGPALDPAAALQRGDELAHRLVGHGRAGGELGEPRPLGVDVLVERVMGGMDAVVTIGLQALDELLDHEPGRLAEGHHDRERPRIFVAQHGAP